MPKVGIAIIHGFNSSTLFMKGVEYELQNWGKLDQVVNISLYGSNFAWISSKYNLSTPILKIDDNISEIGETLVEHVLIQLKEKLEHNITHLFLLGHSMGGLVCRALYKAVINPNENTWLRENSPRIIGIIQLATPNQGSKLTNLRLVELFDQIQTSIFLKIAGYSMNLINRLASAVGLKEQPDQYNSVDETQSTQIKQMKPGSEFLKWLNAEPTFVDKIPHYRVIGQRNGLFFTNLAWTEAPEELDIAELIEEYKEEQNTSKIDDINQILENVELRQDMEDDDIKELRKYLEENEELDDDYTAESIIDQIKVLFDEDEYIPNDGLVSIEDARLLGSNLIPLGDHAHKISHYSVCMWFVPFKPYRYVRDQVLEVMDVEIQRQVQ